MNKLRIFAAVMTTLVVLLCLHSCNYTWSYETGDVLNIFIRPL